MVRNPEAHRKTPPWHIEADVDQLLNYTQPIVFQGEDQVPTFEAIDRKKYDTAFVIGRWQPPHRGHMRLIEEAARQADRVIIGIGSANVSDSDNPFSVDKRRRILELAIEENVLLKGKIELIVPINDYDNDEFWYREVMRKTYGGIDVVLGRNEWVNGIFREKNIPVIEPKLFHREVYEGTKIRDELRRDQELKLLSRTIH